MDREYKKIGKKVWVLEEKCHSWKPNKETIWTIKDYIGWGDERLKGDFHPHIILEDSKGNTKEIREYEAIVVPDTTLPARDMVSKYLSDNELYADDISGEDEKVCVSLEWSDWKHGHIWCETLMKYLGYEQFDEIVTEENGSDCYSSVHYFCKDAA